jgi:hypothetical protein
VVLSAPLARLDALIWALIYAGLLGIALALALRSATPELAFVVGAVGVLVLAAGIVLVGWRARLARRGLEGGTPSSSPPRKTQEGPR